MQTLLQLLERESKSESESGSSAKNTFIPSFECSVSSLASSERVLLQACLTASSALHVMDSASSDGSCKEAT